VKKLLKIAIALIIILAISWVSIDEYKDYKEDKIIDAQRAEIVTHITLPENLNFHQTIDIVREFVVAHSEINMNEEFYSIWHNHPKVLSTFLAGIKKERDTFIPLECGTRTGIMQDILIHLGYGIRTINMYDLSTPSITSHVIIDVLNPETNKWESHDSIYNIYWRNKKTKERATFMNMIGHKDEHEPCNSKKCGWNIISTENQQAKNTERYFYIATVVDRKAGNRYSVYDSKRTSPDTEYTLDNETGTFCKLRAKECRDGYFPAK
jgi:rhodanese-related sulfurtransferase